MKNQPEILITGGTGMLGSALVIALASCGFSVVANFWRDENRALELQTKTGCALRRADVSDEKGVESLFAGQKYRAIFHLAGVSHDAILPRLSASVWNHQLKNNAQSAFLITRAALRNLPRGGQLVLLSSRVAERGFAGQSAYGASKAAILGLMKSAALEGRASGISVNAICPGFAPSALSSELSDEILRARREENWLADANAAQSFAALCVWLLTSCAPTSGQILRPDCRI